jgi:hypothetical protein
LKRINELEYRSEKTYNSRNQFKKQKGITRKHQITCDWKEEKVNR